MTISRYIDKGVLFPIYRGLYASVPVSSLDPLDLGQAIIHRYTYLTTETILSQAGLISQTVFDYTFVADQSKKVAVGQWSFRFRKLKDIFLYHPAGITSQKGVMVASIERAVADMLYFNPRYHMDVPDLVDFKKVRFIQKEIGYL